MGEKEYKEAVTEKNYVTHINHITILGDGNINFNRSIKPKFDPDRQGVSSKDLLHYIDPTLQQQNFEALS